MKGVKYTAREKLKALKMWIEDGRDVLWVAKKMKCTERSLWRWKAQYDGSLESLKNKSSRPLHEHPNSHTLKERKEIENLFKLYPMMSYSEALGVLRSKYAYDRTYFGLYRFVVKNNLRPSKEIEEKVKYIPQAYDTPEMLGHKWQMDVKYVPAICNKTKFPGERLFQYTMIDEAIRERFLFPYKEHCGYSTVDFIKRAITYFGYMPDIIQTDNGSEFTNPHKKGKDGVMIQIGKKHIVDELLDELNIHHQLIRVYTPRHNGKVERSHRSDQESFYNHLTFKSFEELKRKMRVWNNRYNNRPHSSLRNREGKRVWWSPLQKRKDLLDLYKEKREEFEKIRFLKVA